MHPRPLSHAAAAAFILALHLQAQAAGAAPAAGHPVTVELKPAQVAALGILTRAAVPDRTGAARGLPATVLVPAGQQRVLAAPVAALIERLHASVGDRVRAGQVLAVLRSAQVQELQREVLTTSGLAGLAVSTLSRDEQLFQEGLIPQACLEASRAHTRLAQVQQQDRQRALAQAGAAPGSDGSLNLVATIDGVVLERPVVVGQRVDPNTALFRIGKLSPLWLELQMPVDEAGGVRQGDAVQVLRSTARGQVIAVSPVVDGASQTVLVRAELRQPPADLRIGQAVEARIEQGAPGAVQVPAAAVMDSGGQPAVFVEEASGRYRLVTVQMLGSAGGNSSLRGLAVGTKVVDRGTAVLKARLAQP